MLLTACTGLKAVLFFKLDSTQKQWKVVGFPNRSAPAIPSFLFQFWMALSACIVSKYFTN